MKSIRRYILFSEPKPFVLAAFHHQLFPFEFPEKIVAFMPAEGNNPGNEKYMPLWRDYFQDNGIENYLLIDNSKRASQVEAEADKLKKANILIISGGDTAILLKNLRESGLDQEIMKFTKKKEYVIAGFSAGAMVLTPSIQLSLYLDERGHSMKDFQGLGLIDFEVFPHFESSDLVKLEEYKKEKNCEVKTITDDEYVIIDK